MAKKSTAARSSGAARRPQTTAKSTARQAMLVRPSGAGSSIAPAETEVKTPSAGASTSATQATTQAAARPAAVKTTPPAPVKAAIPAKAAAPAPKPPMRTGPATSARAQANRIARAQASKSARAAHLISAENYAYVINDLKLTGVLAAVMLIVIVVLHFILG